MRLLLRSRHFQRLESEAMIDALLSGEVDRIRIPTWAPYEARELTDYIRRQAARSFIIVKTRQEQGCLVVETKRDGYYGPVAQR